jgi:DNA-binding transcriptional ArsR family regulator
MRRDVFQAIADPTRRQILGLLSNEALTLNGIADNFHISRPAVSKHIKILTECGLVVIKPSGRERYCEVQMKPLQEVNLWVQQYKRFWTEKFDNLENFLAKQSTVTIKNIKK